MAQRKAYGSKLSTANLWFRTSPSFGRRVNTSGRKASKGNKSRKKVARVDNAITYSHIQPPEAALIISDQFPGVRSRRSLLIEHSKIGIDFGHKRDSKPP